MTGQRALVVGVTGISGGNLTERLLTDGWEVAGLCRRPDDLDARITPLAADLEDADAVAAAVRGTSPTHVFFTTWQRRATEAENCDVNGRMLAEPACRDGRREVGPPRRARRPGSSTTSGRSRRTRRPSRTRRSREEQARLPYENFYYVQEDILFAAAERDGFTWTVHRPHTLIGWALGNAMNMGVTLAVYAAICRETGRAVPLPGLARAVGGGHRRHRRGPARRPPRLGGDHARRRATRPSTSSTATSSAGGRMWPRLADALGVEAVGFDGEPAPLEQQMADAAEIWPEIVARHGLRDLRVETLASWWHTDADLGRTVETFTDMGRSRRLGFLGVRDTESSFTDLFARLKAERIVP